MAWVPRRTLASALQSYTNNTSSFSRSNSEIPGRGDILLFAADAQVGNWQVPGTGWECPIDGGRATGDLLTIFYKVGHHGSHNATLEEHGVDQMDALKAAIIPVDEKEALKKRWGRMPAARSHRRARKEGTRDGPSDRSEAIQCTG